MVQSDSDNTYSDPVYSMTGYGEGKVEQDEIILEAKIRTLNHDGVSVKVRGLKGDNFSIHRAEKFVKKSFHRGRIDVKVSSDDMSGLSFEMLDHDSIKKSFSSLSRLSGDLGLESEPSLQDLIALDLVKTNLPHESQWFLIKQVLNSAVEDVKKAQREEGQAIREDLLTYLDDLSKHLSEAEEMLPEVVSAYKEQFRERVDDLLEEGEDIEQSRLEQELAVYAEKVDVSEELARTKTHVKSARKALREGGVVGKKLKFLSQEIQRELNTLGAKSKNSGVQTKVIAAKLALDNFKEQARNLT